MCLSSFKMCHEMLKHKFCCSSPLHTLGSELYTIYSVYYRQAKNVHSTGPKVYNGQHPKKSVWASCIFFFIEKKKKMDQVKGRQEKEEEEAGSTKIIRTLLANVKSSSEDECKSIKNIIN